MHPTGTRSLILALALAPVAATPALAQEKPAARFDERLQVTEVQLDVVVTDGDGNLVVGLAPADFIVEEQGEPVELAAATFYGSGKVLDSPAVAGRLGATGSQLPVDRFFILVVDDLLRGSPELVRHQREAVSQAKRWVESELGEHDWVAVAGYYAKLMIYLDFTRDRQAILGALDQLSRAQRADDTWPASVQLGDDPSLMRHLPQGKELRKETTRILDALKLLGEAASHTRGRKNLLLFSIGFGDIDRFGWTPDTRYYPPAVQALNDGNVAVYTISLVGNSFRKDPVLRALGNSLTRLAYDTGGRDFQTFAGFGAPLRQVTEDNGGYYLLSYSARYPAGDSGYREVKVRTVNPTLKVRAREGYLFGS